MSADIAARLRRLSELHRLCARLPHLETPGEAALLARFRELAAAPGTVTAADADALVAGWRAWWRAGRAAEIAAMARGVPASVIDADRHVATYAVAATAAVASEETT